MRKACLRESDDGKESQKEIQERTCDNVPGVHSKPPKEPGDWVRMHLYDEWRDVTGKPEERVRQGFILHLHNHYGYTFEQMDQERRTMHGRRSPRISPTL